MTLSLFFLASLALTCLPLSWSYRDGARSESCYNMLVMHTDFLGGAVPPTSCGSPCEYQLRMVGRVVGENNLTVEEENPTTYQCGEVYQLQLVSTTSSTFEGFMVEARENTASFEEGSTIWGTWVTDPNDPRLYHAVECNRSSSSSEGPFENAATQNSPADLTSLDLYWRAPITTDELQEIKFWFVTVQQRLTYIDPFPGPVLGPPVPVISSSPSSPSTIPMISPTSSSPSTIPMISPTSSSPSPTPMLTTETTPATTESPSLLSREVLIGVIAGASGGGLLLLIILIVIIIIVSVCVRMRKNNRAVIEEEMTFKNKTVL